MNKIRKMISVTLILVLLFGRGANIVLATEAIPASEALPAGEALSSDEKPDKADKPPDGEAQPANEALPAQEASPTEAPIQDPVVVLEVSLVDQGGTNANGNVGDAAVQTGDANNTGAVYNTLNDNLLAVGGGGSGRGTSISNTNNGVSSDNSGSATIVDNNNTDQDNSALVTNNLTQSAFTGDNSASRNVGSASIVTGDANVSGTVITAANTNVAGVSVSEFNIVDDHNGDYILDFAAGCITGCNGGPTTVENSNNGADSTNTGELNTLTNNNTNQANYGNLTNNIDFIADTGSNSVDRNTAGTNSITTGDANVAANLLTFLNNNIAGGVMFGVVNIFGDLIGDIIIPDNVFGQFACGACGGDISVANTNNGSDSDNNALVNDTTNNNVFQSNDANIANNLTLSAESGNNSASKNNQGNVGITTGDTSVDASVLNIANMNLLGGNMWLVIINEAGNWIGKLFGAPDGAVLAGSEGVEFALDPNGAINVINSNNGPDSTNNGTVNNITNNNLTQTNVATVTNNINLFSNTGKNSADKNNGDVTITTGDAQALANIVNFVNNNIAGGKLLVTFVNVFGSWTGDFLTLGSHKEESAVVAQGGVGGSNNSNNQTDQNSQVSNSPNSAVASGPNLIAAAGFSGESNSVSDTTGNSGIKIAGINNSDILAGLTKGITEDKKKANLNLAWLLLTTPLLALGIIARKRIFRKPSLPAGRSA